MAAHDHLVGYSLSGDVTDDDDKQDDIERVAVVTDDTASGVLAKAAEGLSRIDIETFTSDEQKAWA